MIYEEKCQLGFASASNNDIYYFGQDDQEVDYYEQQNHHSEQLHYNNNKENLNLQTTSEYQIKSESDGEGRTIVSSAALKLNYDKKVKFAEQLAFKVENMPLFQGEEPMPITFKNNAKPGMPKKGKKSKKGKTKKSPGFFMPPSLKRPGSAKPKTQAKPLPVWNEDNKQQKFFDPTLDKQKQREEQRAQIQRPQSGIKGAPIVEKNYEEGKYDIAFVKSNGQTSSKFSIYKDIDSLVNDTQKQNYAATGYSLKKMPQGPPQKQLVSALSSQKQLNKGNQLNKDIQIAQYREGDRDEVNVQQQDHIIRKDKPDIINQSMLSKQYMTENKLTDLVGQALTSKEVMIKALEEELEREKQRREEMTNKFKTQLTEFETDRDALERIRKASTQIERQQQQKEQQKLRQEQRMEDDLDLVPTKEKSTSRSMTSKAHSTARKKPTNQPFRADRVKSSIPKMKQSVNATAQKESAKYIEELKKQEVERSIKLQQEEHATQAVLERFRDNPNSHLHSLQNEVGLLSRKVEPLLQKVEQAAKNIQLASGPVLKQLPGPMGMLSKMGGRLISFYADDLAELLLNDFLFDTAQELQKLEQTTKKDFSGEEAKFLAETLMKNLVDYQSEESHVSMKWNNPAFKQQLRPIGLDGLVREPQPIAFNLNEDYPHNTNQYQKTINSNEEQKTMKGRYQNPFGRVDPFSQQLAEISATAPDVSYNMMQKMDGQDINQSNSHHLAFEMKGGKESQYEQKRKYKINIEEAVLTSIVGYREKYDKFLKMHNNTSNKDVWKIYDHLTDDLFHEIYNDVQKDVNKDLEEYIEKVIFDEFQLS